VKQAVSPREEAASLWKSALSHIVTANAAGADGSASLHLDRAASDLQKLVEAFPVGAQQAVITELACLRLGEIDLQRDRKYDARDWYRMVVNGSARTQYVRLARIGLGDIAFRDEDFWKARFRSQRVALACASELDGTPARWSQAAKRVTRFLEDAGAQVRGGEYAVSQLADDAASGDLRRNVRIPDDCDVLVVFVARGTIMELAAGKQHRFAGDVDILVMRQGQKTFSESWNLIDNGMQLRHMCMDNLALNAVKWWEEKYRDFLE